MTDWLKNSCPLWVSNSGHRHHRLTWIPLPHAYWHYLKLLILLLISFPVTWCQWTWTCWCLSWENVSGPLQSHGCEKKKPEGTSYAIFAAISSVAPTEFAAEPTTKKKSSRANLKLELFAFHQKDNWVFFWTFFFPLIKLFLTLVVFAKTRVPMWSRAKNVGYSTGLSQVCATSYWWPCGAEGWTYGQTDGHDYYVTKKISWLDS